MINLREAALLVAERAHRNQTYDIFPYIYHPKQVMHIAIMLGFDEAIIIACILHDVIEDTDLSYNNIKKTFGEEIAEIVFAVTDELGRNRKERKEKTYPKIRANWKATAVKVCDRIANIGHSKVYNKDMIKMYRKEHNNFVNELYVNEHPKDVRKAWNLLEKVFEEKVEFKILNFKKDYILGHPYDSKPTKIDTLPKDDIEQIKDDLRETP